MKRLAVFLLLGTLTAVRAGETPDEQILPEDTTTAKPHRPEPDAGSPDKDGGEEVVYLTGTTDPEEVKRDVEIESPPDGIQTLNGGSEEGELMYTTQAGSPTHDAPEPSTLLLASLGAALLGTRACRRKSA